MFLRYFGGVRQIGLYVAGFRVVILGRVRTLAPIRRGLKQHVPHGVREDESDRAHLGPD